MSAQPQVNAATCGTEVTSLLRILEAPEIRTAYVKKLKPYEVTIVNLALGGALYGKTKYLVDKGQNPADHSSNYLGAVDQDCPCVGGVPKEGQEMPREGISHKTQKTLCFFYDKSLQVPQHIAEKVVGQTTTLPGFPTTTGLESEWKKLYSGGPPAQQ